jgi:hypothetical protein
VAIQPVVLADENAKQPISRRVLRQLVTIRENGVERRVTAAEAFVLQLTKRALEGDDDAARASLAAIEQAKERRGAGQSRVRVLVRAIVAAGIVTSAPELLRMPRKLDPYRETVRMALKPRLFVARWPE